MIPESKLPLSREQIELHRQNLGCDNLCDQALAAIELERERDLAIAHDTQPYPTAWAYEQVCKARESWQERAEAAERDTAELRTIVKALLKQDKLEHPEFMVVRRRARELVGL